MVSRCCQSNVILAGSEYIYYICLECEHECNLMEIKHVLTVGNDSANINA